MTKARIKIWVTRARKTETSTKRDDVCGIYRSDWARKGKAGVCVYMYTILNPAGERVEGHNDPTPALPMVIRMRIAGRTRISESVAIIQTHTCTYIRTYTRAQHVTCVSGRENRPRSKACPWHVGRAARYRTICLENNGNARRASADEYSGIK